MTINDFTLWSSSIRFSLFNPQILLFVLLWSCATVNDLEKYDSFGEMINPEGATTTKYASTQLQDADTLNIKIDGIVTEVCQSKGCWMKLKNDGDKDIRVTFKDYGFFVPKDIAGRHIVAEGVFTKNVLTEEVARHFAEDAGEEFDPDKEYVEYALVAKGVLLEKATDQE